MAKRTPKQDDNRQARAAEEARLHGGLVALMGSLPAKGEKLGRHGPADEHWWFRDEYLAQPLDSWCRHGYVETAEVAENLSLSVNGVNLRWYGPATVWRFDPSLVPPAAVVGVEQPRWLADPQFCTCGERLLLVGEGRTTCERCRLGTVGPVVVWTREHPRELDEWLELPPLDDAPEVAETVPEPPVVLPAQPQRPTLSAEEVGSWVWQQVAHLYDR